MRRIGLGAQGSGLARFLLWELTVRVLACAERLPLPRQPLILLAAGGNAGSRGEAADGPGKEFLPSTVEVAGMVLFGWLMAALMVLSPILTLWAFRRGRPRS